MSVQTTYGYATGKGLAGGIYDMHHYPVDSRFNEEENGKLRFGVGVVPGTIPGSNIKLPTAESTAAQFEGVIVNGFDRQQDLEGKLSILNNQNVGVMRRGRIWVRLAANATPSYGNALHMIVDGNEAGCFATEGGVTIPGRFIGSASNGVAPVELYGIDGSADAADSGSEDAGGGTVEGGGETNDPNKTE
jgi:hypothetical protein